MRHKILIDKNNNYYLNGKSTNLYLELIILTDVIDFYYPSHIHNHFTRNGEVIKLKKLLHLTHLTYYNYSENFIKHLYN